MAGNSQRKGAIRKGKKGPTTGSGGQRRKQLKGRGPTPKAVDREKHPAAKRKRASDKRAAQSGRRTTSSRGASRRRGDSTPEYVVGRNAVAEALDAHIPATALYVAERIDNDDRVRHAVDAANAQSVSVLEAPRNELDRLADGLTHQGLILQVPPYEYAHPDDLVARASDASETPLLIALDHVTDPRNLGAVVRSAAAFGAHGVLVPERRAASMTASAWKTASGAAARVPVARCTNLTRALTAYQKAGLFVVGLDAAGDISIDAVDADVPLVLVVGAEGAGLSRLVRDTCDQVASIPISADTESLNASVAAGIGLYTLARARSR
ncbi:MAG TPA: 23S rRNA (guanosine(2251)-2'-O)-methyltransferase RlmB [Actinomycetes bacterium]|nr:23S rRNA (guanosine(2251)-2'-O)-methyltransferase RlmB [Actinomycetes bacterium]